jgi:hypothetical protein
MISCKEDSDPITVGIDVQGYFENDFVSVFIDNKLVVSGVAQTNPSLGVCYLNGTVSTQTRLSKGTHEIYVMVNKIAGKKETLEINGPLFIGIQYDRPETELSFVLSQTPFMYD